MTQPVPEGSLPELDSGTACVGPQGFYCFRYRGWLGGEAGSAQFLEVPLHLDPLEVEHAVGMPQTPKFWDAFDLARSQASPEQREFMESTTPLHGSVVRACGRAGHDDGVIRASAYPRFEAAGRWAVVEQLGNLAMTTLPSWALRLNDLGIGEVWPSHFRDETINAVAGDVTPDEWLHSRRSLATDDPQVLLARSIVGSYVRIVLHALPIPVPQPDGDRGTVEQLVHVRGSEELAA